MADDKSEILAEDTPLRGDSPSNSTDRVETTPSTEEIQPQMSWRWRAYLVYVLQALVIIYLFNQLDRYLLAVCTTSMAQDLDYGDLACLANSTVSADDIYNCSLSTNAANCTSIYARDGSAACEWTYNGLGFAYDVLAGPIFIVTYTFAGIFLGLAADYYNRKNMLMACFIFWSLMTLLTGAVNEYWQLALLRFGLGIGEAGCTPFAAALIGDYFPTSMRATALGFYNWGIYIGYSLSYAFGTFITEANINGQGWRWAFYLAGIPGIALGILYLFTIREPERTSSKSATDPNNIHELMGDDVTWYRQALTVVKQFGSPSLIIICIAGSVRNLAGYVWGYYAYIFFEAEGQSSSVIGTYLSWIPIVGGVFSVVLGGLIADKVTVRIGPRARIGVIVISLLVAAPFALAVLYADPPGAYYYLLPTYIFGEMWVGITLAVLVEMVPTALRASCVAFYFFIISNIAGLGPIMVTPMQNLFVANGFTSTEGLRYTLVILYPGCYVLGGLIYLLSLPVLSRDVKAMRANYETLK